MFLSCCYGDGGSSLGSDAGPGSVQEGIVSSKHGERNSQEQWLPLSQGQIGVTQEGQLLLQAAHAEGQVAGRQDEENNKQGEELEQLVLHLAQFCQWL